MVANGSSTRALPISTDWAHHPGVGTRTVWLDGLREYDGDRVQAGNLLAEKADALDNAVNCVGNMGASIAMQFRNAWPENFRAYTMACRSGRLQPGRMFTFETCRLAPPRYIINLPYKRHWRSSSRLEDIDVGLGALTVEIRRLGFDSIAVPLLGAGLGGLPWNAVRERVERVLGTLPRLRVAIFEPLESPEPAGGGRPN